MHTTLKGIHSYRVGGDLVGRYVPKQRKQVKQSVRSGKSQQGEFRTRIKRDEAGKRVNSGAFMEDAEFCLCTLFLK